MEGKNESCEVKIPWTRMVTLISREKRKINGIIDEHRASCLNSSGKERREAGKHLMTMKREMGKAQHTEASAGPVGKDARSRVLKSQNKNLLGAVRHG